MSVLLALSESHRLQESMLPHSILGNLCFRRWLAVDLEQRLLPIIREGSVNFRLAFLHFTVGRKLLDDDLPEVGKDDSVGTVVPSPFDDFGGCQRRIGLS
ncbi:MAG: hypothetical protein M2R45_02130 [Verrucomicrobia subdivision 3 bacterium]|nr:hypothetical protein [Limisphaerales bacterium]MCS1413812.1 hypothetical protein [Limisphaerales bacterium]